MKGKAKFCFKNILDNEIYNLEVSDQNPEVVETVPGWAHDITNIGNDILIVFYGLMKNLIKKILILMQWS